VLRGSPAACVPHGPEMRAVGTQKTSIHLGWPNGPDV